MGKDSNLNKDLKFLHIPNCHFMCERLYQYSIELNSMAFLKNAWGDGKNFPNIGGIYMKYCSEA